MDQNTVASGTTYHNLNGFWYLNLSTSGPWTIKDDVPQKVHALEHQMCCTNSLRECNPEHPQRSKAFAG